MKEPTKGFLVNDISYFGVEVFVSQGSSLGECHSLSAVGNISGKYKWVITQFSKLGLHGYSDEFVVGGFKWYEYIVAYNAWSFLKQQPVF